MTVLVLQQFARTIVEDERLLNEAVYAEIGTILASQLDAADRTPLPKEAIRETEKLLCIEAGSATSAYDYVRCGAILARIINLKLDHEEKFNVFAIDFLNAVADEMQKDVDEREMISVSETTKAHSLKQNLAELTERVNEWSSELKGEELKFKLYDIVSDMKKYRHRDRLGTKSRALFAGFLRDTFLVKSLSSLDKDIEVDLTLRGERNATDVKVIGMTTAVSSSSAKRSTIKILIDKILRRSAHPDIESALAEPEQRRIVETYGALALVTSGLSWRGLRDGDVSKENCLRLVHLLELLCVEGRETNFEKYDFLNQRRDLFDQYADGDLGVVQE